MKISQILLATLLSSAVAFGCANAADTNTYQVTGPVLSVTPTTIVVQKGKEKWEIAQNQATVVKGGELKAGEKVTIQYRMTAASIEIKAAKK